VYGSGVTQRPYVTYFCWGSRSVCASPSGRACRIFEELRRQARRWAYPHKVESRTGAIAGYTVSYNTHLRLPFSRPGSGFFAVAAISAARSFAILLISFTGTGLVSVKCTVPFRKS
jgi:hypothetical protein